MPNQVKPIRFPPDLDQWVRQTMERSKTLPNGPYTYTDVVLRAVQRDKAHAERSRRPKRRPVRNTTPGQTGDVQP